MSYTELTNAVSNNDWETYKSLVKAGSNINKCDRYGWAPIHLAMYHDDQLISRDILRNKTFNVNCRRKGGKETPIMYAILFERQEIARDLLSRPNIDLKAKNAEGEDYKDYLRMRELPKSWLH